VSRNLTLKIVQPRKQLIKNAIVPDRIVVVASARHGGEFPHNYYTFESMHDGDHEDVVRIGLSCELGGLIIYQVQPHPW